MHAASSHIHHAHSFGWKSYHLLKKKAMEQELSWSGLAVSLSIAFFIVVGCATILRYAEYSLTHSRIVPGQAENLERGKMDMAGMAQSIFTIPSASAAAPAYQASSTKNTEMVTLSKGATKTQSITFKNTGSSVWKPASVSFETGPFLRAFSKVKADDWKNYFQPVALTREVKPGQSVTVSFSIKAPADIEGMIQENFQLVANSQPVPGSLVRVFVTVTSAAAIPSAPAPAPSSLPASSPVPPVSSGGTASSGSAASRGDLCIASYTPGSAEYSNCNTSLNESNAGNGIASTILINTLPMMRVGLFSSSSAQRLTADRAFDIYGGGQPLIQNLAAGSVVTFSYDTKSSLYAAVAPAQSVSSRYPLRLVPRTTGGIVTILDYRAGQKPQDNRFRNIVELNYSASTKAAWFINELPIDDYVKGLAETTNASPVEFQKVMAVIARTYGLYHYLRGVAFGIPDGSTKHAAEHFHVDSVYDQVYRGYNSELRLTGLTQAVDATRGVAVTYNSALALTPYFSNSGGRTLDWTEVWGGAGMPWLKSVPVPQDAGKALYGHGVGLSARGALLMVIEGKGWQDVLKYFYTGTEMRKVY